jgi:hypothetical protein
MLGQERQSKEKMYETNSLNICIGIPAYSNQVHSRCTQTLIWMDRVLNKAGISHYFRFLGNESLIPRARAFFANMAAFDTDETGQRYSHLLFMDADLSWDPNVVLTMLKVDQGIVALPYSLKTINWAQVVEAVKNGVTAEQLPRFIGTPVVAMHNQSFQVNEPTAVRSAGIGAVLMKVSVLESLAAANAAWKYQIGEAEIRWRQSVPGAVVSDKAFDFFKIGPDVESGLYLSEDFAFMEAARKIGFETFLLPWVRTIHSGAFNYEMDISAIGSLSNKAGTA